MIGASQGRVAALFLLPAMALMTGIFLVPLAGVAHQSVTNPVWTLEGYAELTTSTLFLRVLWTTFEISLSSSLATLILAYPIAYHLAKQPPRRRALLMTLVMVPFWTSILVKSYAFTVILGQHGAVNSILAWSGLPTVKLLFNRIGVIIGMGHYLIPFMVFPILNSLLAQPPDLAKAARVMGAGKLRIFWRVTLPLSMPGVMAGFLLSMILSLGFFVTPALLGGRKDMMMANLVDMYTRETLDWTMASAIAMILLALSGILIAALSRTGGGKGILGGTAH
ncbi:MAG: ABC transporter permease [Alphaproteobacteria bacterium]